MRWRWVLAVGVAIGVVKFSLLFIGMDVGMPAGLASLVLQAQALFTVVLAAAAAARADRRLAGAGLAVAFGGLALVAGGLDGVATAAGFALVIAAAAAWGFGNLALKRAAPADPLRFMTGCASSRRSRCSRSRSPSRARREICDAIAGADLGGVGAVLYLAFAATTVGWGLWGALMARYPASTVAPFSLLVPVFGLSFGALLLGEPVTVRELVAGGADPRWRAPDPAPAADGDFSARSGILARRRLDVSRPRERVPPDAEVRDAESEAIEVRGPPP